MSDAFRHRTRVLTIGALALVATAVQLAPPAGASTLRAAADAPAVTLTTNHVGVAFGQAVTLSGTVTNAGAPVVTDQIQLTEKSLSGVEEPVGVLTSAADGSFSTTVLPYFNGTFYAHYETAVASIPSRVSVAAHHIAATVRGDKVTVVAQFTPGVAFKGTLRVPLSQVVTDKYGVSKTVKTTLVIGPRVAAKGLPFGYGTATLKLTLPTGAYTVTIKVPTTTANDAGPAQNIYFKVK